MRFIRKELLSPINGMVVNFGGIDKILEWSSNYEHHYRLEGNKYHVLAIYQPVDANKEIISPMDGTISDVFLVRGNYEIVSPKLYRSQKEENRMTIVIKTKEDIEITVCIFFGGEKWITPSISLENKIENLRNKAIFAGERLMKLEFHSYAEVYVRNQENLSLKWYNLYENKEIKAGQIIALLELNPAE